MHAYLEIDGHETRLVFYDGGNGGGHDCGGRGGNGGCGGNITLEPYDSPRDAINARGIGLLFAAVDQLRDDAALAERVRAIATSVRAELDDYARKIRKVDAH